MSIAGRLRIHRARAETPKRFFDENCEACGGRVRVELEHYQRVRCRHCGKIFWALQPNLNGELKLFPWPGVVYEPEPEQVTNEQ
jgi:ribosomal protein S27E